MTGSEYPGGAGRFDFRNLGRRGFIRAACELGFLSAAALVLEACGNAPQEATANPVAPTEPLSLEPAEAAEEPTFTEKVIQIGERGVTFELDDSLPEEITNAIDRVAGWYSDRYGWAFRDNVKVAWNEDSTFYGHASLTNVEEVATITLGAGILQDEASTLLIVANELSTALAVDSRGMVNPEHIDKESLSDKLFTEGISSVDALLCAYELLKKDGHEDPLDMIGHSQVASLFQILPHQELFDFLSPALIVQSLTERSASYTDAQDSFIRSRMWELAAFTAAAKSFSDRPVGTLEWFEEAIDNRKRVIEMMKQRDTRTYFAMLQQIAPAHMGLMEEEYPYIKPYLGGFEMGAGSLRPFISKLRVPGGYEVGMVIFKGGLDPNDSLNVNVIPIVSELAAPVDSSAGIFNSVGLGIVYLDKHGDPQTHLIPSIGSGEVPYVVLPADVGDEVESVSLEFLLIHLDVNGNGVFDEADKDIIAPGDEVRVDNINNYEAEAILNPVVQEPELPELVGGPYQLAQSIFEQAESS